MSVILGRLLLLFTLVPLGELLLLVEIGERIGAGPTVGLVLLTGVVGASLARREGTRSLRAIQDRLSSGALPGRELFHGLLILLAGAFLVTPGVLTDAVGFGLLARPVRDRVIDAIRRRLEDRMARGEAGGWSTGRGIYFSFGSDPSGRKGDSRHGEGTGGPRGSPDRGASGDGPDGEEPGRGRVIEI